MDISTTFTYHPPFGDQPARYALLRGAGKVLAQDIMDNCPSSRERSLALTKVQEAIMWANASIAINEAPKPPDMDPPDGQGTPARPEPLISDRPPDLKGKA